MSISFDEDIFHGIGEFLGFIKLEISSYILKGSDDGV
jgi:hypothetical protein